MHVDSAPARAPRLDVSEGRRAAELGSMRGGIRTRATGLFIDDRGRTYRDANANLLPTRNLDPRSIPFLHKPTRTYEARWRTDDGDRWAKADRRSRGGRGYGACGW